MHPLPDRVGHLIPRSGSRKLEPPDLLVVLTSHPLVDVGEVQRTQVDQIVTNECKGHRHSILTDTAACDSPLLWGQTGLRCCTTSCGLVRPDACMLCQIPSLSFRI